MIPIESIDELSPPFLGREPLEDCLWTVKRRAIVASLGMVHWKIQSIHVTARMGRVDPDHVDVLAVRGRDETVDAELVRCPCVLRSPSHPDRYASTTMAAELDRLCEPDAAVLRHRATDQGFDGRPGLLASFRYWIAAHCGISL